MPYLWFFGLVVFGMHSRTLHSDQWNNDTCQVNKFSSRMCERGTKSCVSEHATVSS